MKAQLTNTQLIVLGLIAEQPRHGYEIEQVIQERGMREWVSLGFSSIYFVLEQLSKMGYIKPLAHEKEKGKKIYKITQTGEVACREAVGQALMARVPYNSALLAGIANSPMLTQAEFVEILKQRILMLCDCVTHVESAKATHAGAPEFVQALFEYNLSLTQAERAWLTRTVTKLQNTMDKVDLKKELKELYNPTAKEFTHVTVPKMSFVMVDGSGDPNVAESYKQAVEALYAVAYAIKFASKKQLGKDYGVMPLEGLWTADDMTAFTARDKASWQWTMMIMQPDWITADIFAQAIETVRGKKNPAALDLVKFESYDEGESVQIMHIGSYDDEAPTLHRLHAEYLPQHGLQPSRRHHEIYLGDPRKTDPSKLKTILRQPTAKV